MNVDPKETILDTCLDEVLGNQPPPDLSARILNALEQHNQKRNGNRARLSVVTSIDGDRVVPLPPPVQDADTSSDYESLANLAASDQARGQRGANWSSTVTVAIVLMIGVTIGLVVLKMSDKKRDGDTNPIVDAGDKSNVDVANESNSVQVEVPDRGERESHVPVSPPAIVNRNDEFSKPPPFGYGKEYESPKFDPANRRQRGEPSPQEEVIAFIDSTIQEQWSQRDVKPSKLATDEAWCRRVYLRLAGRIPTVSELEQFVKNKDKSKKEKLVDQLVSSDEYVRHWSIVWANSLIGRFGGSDPNNSASREGLEKYLRDSLASNKSYDQMTFELLTATGSGKPGNKDFNGAVNFLLAGLSDNAEVATAHTSRVFLGKNLQCVQCHDHHISSWKQQDFWELNAFFRQIHAKRDGNAGNVRLVNKDFIGDSGAIDDAEIYYELPNGLVHVAYPVLPDDSQVSTSGRLSEIDRRETLANWIVRSDDLSKATVNRVWSHFFRFGFTRQIDDMGPHSPVSHPELLDRLANEFAAHDYSLKDLTRWFALSKPFGLSSDLPAGKLVDAPENGNPPLFSRYYMRPMQPEEVYQSLLAVAKTQTNAADADQRAQARQAWINGIYARSGSSGTTIDPHINAIEAPSLPHASLTQGFISGEHTDFLRRLAESKMSDEKKIEHLFLTAVSRKPRPKELDLARSLYAANETDKFAVLEVVWWALLNSNEFVLDH